jgi:hypothetical protein
MPHTPKNWRTESDPLKAANLAEATPINGEALEDLEVRLSDYSDEVVEDLPAKSENANITGNWNRPGELDIGYYGAELGEDSTTAILEGLADVEAIGRSKLHAPGGEDGYGITEQIAVPGAVAFRGDGSGHQDAAYITSFECLHADAQIAFGERGVESRGGRSGDFRVHGRDIATQPLYFGLRVNSKFLPITVRNAVGIGCLIEEAQNLQLDIEANANAGGGVRICRGAGGLVLIEPRIDGNGVFDLETAQDSVAGPVSGGPGQIKIFGGQIEREHPTVETEVIFRHRAGQGITFYGTLFSISSEATVDTAPLRVIEVLTPGAGTVSNDLSFVDCHIQGGSAAPDHSTGIYSESGTAVFLAGVTKMVNLDKGIDSDHYVDVSGKIKQINVNTLKAGADSSKFLNRQDAPISFLSGQTVGDEPAGSGNAVEFSKSVWALEEIVARAGQTGITRIGALGPLGEAGIKAGPADGTEVSWYKKASNVWGSLDAVELVDNYFKTLRGSSTDALIGGSVTGDAVLRFQAYASGKQEWGDGSAARDVSQERLAAGVLGVGAGHVYRTGRGVTGSRPNAATAGAGASWFDTTLGRMLWSDGTSWIDPLVANAGVLRRASFIGLNRLDASAITTQGMTESGGASLAGTNASKCAFYIDPADFAITGLTTTFLLRLTYLINATRPTSTFTADLLPVTASAGGAAAGTITTGASVGSAAVADPAAGAKGKVDSTGFTLTAGLYAMQIAVSVANMVANSTATIRTELLVHNIP